MTTTATINAHPTDPDIIVLRTPPDMASEMGRFAPARYDPQTRAYILLAEHVDALRKFATRSGIHIVDQRQAPPGPRTQMPECTNCGQPAKLNAQPDWCPACGERWKPMFAEGHNGSGVRLECRACGHRQTTAFRWCGKCGAAMPEPPKGGKPLTLDRPKLTAPKPLAQTIVETLPLLEADRDVSREHARHAIDTEEGE